jgi:rare lipoprotein A
MRLLAFLLLFFGAISATNATAQGRLISTGTASARPNETMPNSTSSGVVYDPTSLTAAHRFLPYGTRLRVVNTANNKQVEVVVNDRGPFERADRIVELSYAASQLLAISNTANVQLYVVDNLPDSYFRLAPTFEKWSIQVASVADINVANQLIQRLGTKSFKAAVQIQGRTMYRIFYGKYNRRTEMASDKATLRRRGFQPLEKYLIDEHFNLAF